MIWQEKLILLFPMMLALTSVWLLLVQPDIMAYLRERKRDT